jgi:scyllo-inositol 2-dehydrogenase (NAD+)
VFLEKPIAIELHEADELCALARKNGLKFTIGYSQRFNPKFAYVRKSIHDGAIGRPVSALVSRHITRSLGKKITGRGKLSPAAMESTHDLDFVLWCLEPAKPVRVYSQVNYGAMKESTRRRRSGQPVDHGHHGHRALVRGRRRLEPAAGLSEFLDDVDRDDRNRRLRVRGRQSSGRRAEHDEGRHAPATLVHAGEFVEHSYAGPMKAETVHFLEAVACDRPVLVTPEQARAVMELYIAADLSAERNEPVNLPLPESRA